MKSPHQIAEDRVEMAEQYSKYSGQFADLVKKRADYYIEERLNFKSDTAVERAWERTVDGVQMTIVKLKLKALEKQLSASNTMLRILENESRNLY